MSGETPEEVHPAAGEIFYDGDHTDIIPAKGEKVQTDHLGYDVEGLKAKAANFIEKLKAMGASAVPTVEGLIKDFHKRHG